MEKTYEKMIYSLFRVAKRSKYRKSKNIEGNGGNT